MTEAKQVYGAIVNRPAPISSYEVFTGEVKASGETVTKQVKTVAQSRQEIKQMFKGSN